ncbi:MAG: VOC family protein [Chloroflexi bacterium]|nr:VOC family protein [Chloroflexota bacterium]
MPALTLDHVVIAVYDLDAATEDYTNVLGRAPSWRGEHPKYGTRNTLFRIDNTYVELLALSGAQGDKRWSGELQRFLEQRGEGLYALALGTPDIRSTVNEMRENGLEVMDPADGHGIDLATGAERAWRNAMVAPKGTNGVRLFFIQHLAPPEALAVAAPVDDEACVRRMDHAVILSADMEAARRVWSDVLGVRLALDRTFPDRNTRILFYRLADITIEISGGSAQSREGIGKADRFFGLAWGVDSIEKMCARLTAAGVETSGPRPGIKPGTLVATVKGPATHGVATLLIEHTPQSFEADARQPQRGAVDNAPQQRAFTATGLDHISVTTPDLIGTVMRWASTLNLPVTQTHDLPGEGRVARIPAGNAYIALTQPAEASDIAAAMADRGQGMHAVAITVDNIDEAVRDLRVKGVEVTDPTAGRDPGTRIARVSRAATNGVPLILIQHD